METDAKPRPTSVSDAIFQQRAPKGLQAPWLLHPQFASLTRGSYGTTRAHLLDSPSWRTVDALCLMAPKPPILSLAP